MKTWQEVALDLGVLAAATVLTALKVVTPEMFLLIVGPLVGAHVAKRGEAAKSTKGKSAGESVAPPSSSAVMALVLGAAALLTRRNG